MFDSDSDGEHYLEAHMGRYVAHILESATSRLEQEYRRRVTGVYSGAESAFDRAQEAYDSLRDNLRLIKGQYRRMARALNRVRRAHDDSEHRYLWAGYEDELDEGMY